jgi:predicted transcriptional regulator
MSYKDIPRNQAHCFEVLKIAVKANSGFSAAQATRGEMALEDTKKAIADLCRKQCLRFDSLYHKANKGERTYLITTKGRGLLEEYKNREWRAEQTKKDAEEEAERKQNRKGS